MKTALLFVACGATVGLALPLPSAVQSQQQVFRTTSQTVAVYVTVRESSGRLVPDLPKDAFELYDNGKRVDLTVFSNDIQPFTTVLLLDMSRSMSKQYGRVVDSAKHFVAASVDVSVRDAGRMVRVSPALYNTADDIDRFLDVAKPLVRG